MTPETLAARALLVAGLADSAVDRVVRMLDVNDSDDRASVDIKVAELKASMPGVFAPGRVPPPAGSRLSSRDAKVAKWAAQTNGKTMEEAGREAAARLGIDVKPPAV